MDSSLLAMIVTPGNEQRFTSGSNRVNNDNKTNTITENKNTRENDSNSEFHETLVSQSSENNAEPNDNSVEQVNNTQLGYQLLPTNNISQILVNDNLPDNVLKDNAIDPVTASLVQSLNLAPTLPFAANPVNNENTGNLPLANLTGNSEQIPLTQMNQLPSLNAIGESLPLTNNVVDSNNNFEFNKYLTEQHSQNVNFNLQSNSSEIVLPVSDELSNSSPVITADLMSENLAEAPTSQLVTQTAAINNNQDITTPYTENSIDTIVKPEVIGEVLKASLSNTNPAAQSKLEPLAVANVASELNPALQATDNIATVVNDSVAAMPVAEITAPEASKDSEVPVDTSNEIKTKDNDNFSVNNQYVDHKEKAHNAYSNNQITPKNLTETSVTDQIKMHVSKAVTSGDNKLTVQLSPGELGKIHISIETNNVGKNTITITTEKIHTLDLLQKDLRSLEKTLMDVGFKSDATSLNLGLNNGNSSNQSQREQMQQNFNYENYNYSDEILKPQEFITKSYLAKLSPATGIDISV